MPEIGILQNQYVGFSFVPWSGAEGKVTHLKEEFRGCQCLQVTSSAGLEYLGKFSLGDLTPE